MYEGYLYSSTVDYTATSPPDRLYTWTLLVLGYILPNLLILLSHLTILGLYRHNKFEAWEAGQSMEASHSFVIQKLKVERRLWRGSLSLLAVWIVSWSPYVGVFLAFITGNSQLVNQHLDMFPGETGHTVQSDSQYDRSHLLQDLLCSQSSPVRPHVALIQVLLHKTCRAEEQSREGEEGNSPHCGSRQLRF